VLEQNGRDKQDGNPAGQELCGSDGLLLGSLCSSQVGALLSSLVASIVRTMDRVLATTMDVKIGPMSTAVKVVWKKKWRTTWITHRDNK
jgi:hypothetical protein